MLLFELKEYAKRLSGEELPPEFYRPRRIDRVLHIAEDGISAELGYRRSERHVENAPYVQRSGTKVPPYLLIDNAEFVLGLPRADKQGTVTDKARQEATRRHEAYRELALRWATVHRAEPSAAAVETFFARGGVQLLDLPDDVDAQETIAVMVGQRWLHRENSVQRTWVETVRERKGGGSGVCLVCGQHRELFATIPETVKKGSIPTLGGSNEAQLVSINTEAQGRRGALQLANTPVCYECGGRAMAVLNYLLGSDTHSRRFRDDGVLLWWTRDGGEDDLLARGIHDEPEPEDITHCINAAYGEPDPYAHQVVEADTFRGVSLALNNSRLVVREWIDVTVGRIKASLGAWYQDIEIYDGWEDKSRYPPVWLMALSCGRWDGKRYVPKSAPRGLEAQLLQCLLQHTPPPARALPRVLQRIQADQHLDAPRIALIRLTLNRSSTCEDVMPRLDENRTDPAYIAGRIFAVFEGIQRAALGPGVNATIRDKHFSAAVSSPDSVLNSLFMGSGAHFKKLRRDNPGAGINLENKLLDLYGKVRDDLPKHLNAQQQGRFIIGYAHQRGEDLAAARANSQNGGDETPGDDGEQ